MAFDNKQPVKLTREVLNTAVQRTSSDEYVAVVSSITHTFGVNYRAVVHARGSEDGPGTTHCSTSLEKLVRYLRDTYPAIAVTQLLPGRESVRLEAGLQQQQSAAPVPAPAPAQPAQPPGGSSSNDSRVTPASPEQASMRRGGLGDTAQLDNLAHTPPAASELVCG
jgi:hypothetical protein